MPGDEKKNITINKTDTGFPSYLDFDKLRTEGIAYLGKLSGKLWTDHNVHDPGITILEELCYAVLDLGYRTNLPVEDIMARKPGDKTPDDNFFTPAEILTCNPLTINDYRKLLIDIPGIKNAWLKPAIDSKDRCQQPVTPEPVPTFENPDIISRLNENRSNEIRVVPTKPVMPACTEFLNGLYHVYLETEQDYPQDSPKLKELLALVRKALMAHRNLCEDFEDIFILCKLEMGVCASIEIEDNANAENVFMAVANKLRDFFSPAPVFYTLPQLLEKGKSIEEIFSGRPYSMESHGFVDTEELEKIRLKKEIHTSDVYNAIFEVPGVRKISKLILRNCGKDCGGVNEKKSYWKFQIPENHIPSFSMNCSGFEFTRNGLPLTVDTEKFSTLFEISFTHMNKVSYKLPSPYLDNEIPTGIFHSDLNSYFSVQNDFPQVYGIGEGGLPDTASDQRKAWALQLKAYLLFFDQLLANYISQLKNIRQLFNMRGTRDAKDRHTYFANTLQTLPQLNKLVRFGTVEENNSLGSAGTTLVFPVWKDKWENTKTDLLTAEEIFQLQRTFSFADLNSMDEAASGLRDELMSEEEITIKTFRTADDCWLFTIGFSAEKWILLGKKAIPTESEAVQQANAVKYLAVFENNYRSFLTTADRYTFNIELNLFSYADYLGLLMEDEELYKKRKKELLSHLLSRFAEKFTGFSLLNWKAGFENKAITSIENYLSRYDDISRNRGRAFDYLTNGWGNDNISGFEKKLKSLAGIDAMQKNYVCPFTVDLYDEQYVLEFGTVAGASTFTFPDKFDLYEDAINAAATAINAMTDPGRYQLLYTAESRKYQLLLNFDAARPAVYTREFTNSKEAEKLIVYLSNSYAKELDKNDIVENSRTWKARLIDSEKKTLKTALTTWHSKEEASKAIAEIAENINNPEIWNPVKANPSPTNYYYDKNKIDEFRFVDLSAFNVDINNTIIDKPGRYTYEVLDKATNSFKIYTLADFENPEDAKEHCYTVLAAAADKENIHISRNQESKRFMLEIWINGKAEAINEVGYKSKPEAENDRSEIASTIQKFCYWLVAVDKVETYKFRIQFGQEENKTHWFYSNEAFHSWDSAASAGRIFLKQMQRLDLSDRGGKITILDTQDKKTPPVTYEPGLSATPEPVESIKIELEKRKQLDRLATAQSENRLKEYIKVDAVGKFDSFVYKLVKKNCVPAVFTEMFKDELTAKNRRKELAARSKQALQLIPEICLGGEIIREVKDNENNTCYRYQIKLHNVTGAPGGELVLFESTALYHSQDEACKAFQENYLIILRDASDKEEYGKSISIAPVPIKDKEDCTPYSSIVYIPVETLKFLIDQMGSTWPSRLAEYIRTYPVKIIDADSKEFAALFCRDYVEPVIDCAGNKTNWVYYFSLPLKKFLKNEQSNEWRSISFYTSATEAMTGFRYFSRLLKYTGNYFTECGCSKIFKDTGDNQGAIFYTYKIFIREVLVQSVNWFEQASDAWGPKGIEKFICAVQAGNATKNHQRKSGGCYSSYYTCGNGILAHPCKYDTAKQRDKALDELYNYWKRSDETKAFGWSQDGKKIVLSDGTGKPFAESGIESSGIKDYCEYFTLMAERMRVNDLEIIYHKKGWLSCEFNIGQMNFIFLSNEHRVIEDPEAIEKWIQEWKKDLFNWACYFPVTRTIIPGASATNQYKYCIEIKLPGFSSCGEDEELNIPCICKENKSPGQPVCYIAWKGNCCYYSCKEAMDVYSSAGEILNNRKNYQASFDCECNSFGINLHTLHPVLITSKSQQETKSDVIAINPQCYDTPDETCEAACIAEKLLNSEGLHLAEHILLRPHCDEDCNCNCRDHRGECRPECNFPPYPSGDKDPCSEKPAKICFKPGSDPYSFIATMILPSWSQRFRQESNRIVLEKLIYQEAPAHVLLRILWLRPYDFCLLESVFKNWNRWLAGKQTCDDGFDPCDMIKLLFCRDYKCLDENFECKPCEEPGGEKPPDCFKIEQGQAGPEILLQQKKDRFKFLNQVNDVFCMERYCDEKKIPEIIPQQSAIEKRNTIGLKEPERKSPVTTSGKQKKKIQVKAIEPATPAQPENPEAKIERKPDQKLQKDLHVSVIRARQWNNKNAADSILEDSKGNQLAGRVKSFLMATEPESEALDQLTSDILDNKNLLPKTSKQLTIRQQFSLLQAAICGYLDKACFNGNSETLINALQPITERMIKAGIDMQAIYDFWNAKEVVSIEPLTDIDFIHFILVGKKELEK